MMRSFTLGMLMSVAVSMPVWAQYNESAKDISSYDDCIDASGGSLAKLTDCTANETRRIYRLVEEKYSELAQNEYFKNWNDEGHGHLRFSKLQNNWLQYRNNYCSVYAYTFNNGAVLQAELSEAECALEITKRHNRDLDALLKLYKEQL